MTRSELAAAWVQDHRIAALEDEIQRIDLALASLMRRVSTQPHLARGIAELRHQKRDVHIRIALVSSGWIPPAKKRRG